MRAPEKKKILPYTRQTIDNDDIDEVVEVLKSDWLTTGPAVSRLEEAVAKRTGAAYGIAVSSGTAALHCIMYAAGIGPGDEVVVPALTFAATSNTVVYMGGKPVFADVNPETLLVDPMSIRDRITASTKAVVAVDFAGQPCDYDELEKITYERNLTLLVDACHSLGGSYKGREVGSIGSMTAFSFHPAKQITTGEGGMVMTDDESVAECLRTFRNHGITTDLATRSKAGTWFYEMDTLGFNYRLSDIHAALGHSQLKKMDGWLIRREELAKRYNELLSGLNGVCTLERKSDRRHANHLYIAVLDSRFAGSKRQKIYSFMRENGIGVNVHYIPVYFHPYYRKTFGNLEGICPRAEDLYNRILTLPLFPGMSFDDVEKVVTTLELGLKNSG